MTVAADMSGSALPPTAEELARAWHALRAGQFRDPQPSAPRPLRSARAGNVPAGPVGDNGAPQLEDVASEPIAAPVVLVLGAHGWSGASTTALLLAEAAARAGAAARVVDVADPTTSGLVGASVTEHGQDESGEWRRGSRTVHDTTGQPRHVWLERLSWPTPSASAIPAAAVASPAGREGTAHGSSGLSGLGGLRAAGAVGAAGLTVVDSGRPLADLLRLAEDPAGQHHWLSQLLRAAPVVVTARATVAGIQRAGAAVTAVRDLRGAAVDALAGQAPERTLPGTSAQVLEQMLVDGTDLRTREADPQSAPVVVTLVGSSRLPRLLEDVLGATLPTITAADRGPRPVEGRERLALIPAHGDLTVQGVTSSELPRQLVPAATRLLHATGYRAEPASADQGDLGAQGAQDGAVRPPRRWRAHR